MFESKAGSGIRFWEAVDDPDTLQRYREFIALADCGLYQVDSSGLFVAVNDTILEQTGYASEDLLGEHVSTLLDDDDVDRIERARRDSLDAGTRSLDSFDVSIETADGDQLPFELRINLLVDNGDRRGSIGAVHKRSAADRDSDRIASAGESIDSITTVLDEANIGVFVLDEEFEVAWIDETVEEYFGLDRDSVIGRDKRRLVEGSVKYRFPDPDRFAETVLATYDDNSYIERFECHIMAGADREERWLEHYSKPIESGEFEGGRIELYYDITDRKQSEDSRQETEQRFHSLVDAVEEYAIFRLDEDGYVTSWNEGVNAIKGYDRTEILGEHFSTFYTDEDRAANVPQQNLDAAVESGSVEDEGWRVRKDGSRFYANVTITAIRDDDGVHQGFLKVTRDMTDRYERERELEGELQRIFGRISDGFYALDEDYQFTHVNERAEQILAVDAEELLGANVWTAFPEIQDTAFEEHYREAMTTQESVAFEGYYPPNDAWYEVHVYPSETGLSVYFRDVTERREREQELQQAERRFEATFEDPNILVGLLDPNGTVLDINQTAMEYIDADLSDVTGEPFWETPWWGDGDDVQCDVKEWTERAIAGEYVDFEADLTRPNGDHYTLSGYFRPVMNDDGDVVSIIVSDRDVTERKEREQRLEQRAMQQQTVADLGQLALKTDDIDDLMHEAASQVADALDTEYCKVLDLDDERDELLLRQGVGWRDGIVGEAAVSAVEANSQAAYTLANDHPIVVEDLDTESRFSGPDLLTSHDVCSGISTVIGPFDEPWGILGTHDTDRRTFTDQDVTFVQSVSNVLAEAIDRTETERRLRERTSQLNVATDAASIGLWTWNIQDDIVTGDEYLAETYGIDPETAMKGTTMDSFYEPIHEADTAQTREHLERAAEVTGELKVEYRVRDATGDLRWVEARGEVEYTDAGEPIRLHGAIADITDRKERERELERALDLLTKTERIADVAGWEVDPETKEPYWSDHLFELLDVDYDEQPSLEDALDVYYTTEDQKTVEGAIDEALDSGESFEEEVRFPRPNGDVGWLRIKGDPEVEDGDVVSLRGALQDVTEQVERERQLEKLVDRLEESNERLEQFAYAASHDLQEPLRMVSSYLQLIEQRYEDELDQDGQEFLEFAVDGADRMREMIDGLLEYSRVETQGNPFEPVDLDTVLDDVRDDLQLTIEESDAEVTTEELPTVEGDVSQLRQVFLNLLDNAIEYSGDEPPRIHVSAEREGSEWIVSVRDEGIGIDSDHADRVFEVFESLYTNDEYAGTGIGLALCERIVERHGGTIWVESEPSEGSTFSFTLPTTDERVS